MLPSKRFSPNAKPIGILGGGQLARMLVLKAHEMGLPIAVLCEHSSEPAAQVAQDVTIGKLSDPRALSRFLKKCRLVTFESEFLDASLLAGLASKTGTTILPRPSDMRLIQDRSSQKRLLVAHALPTSDFADVNNVDDARETFARFGRKVVFKKRRFGYDGYGTFVVRSNAELENFVASFDKIPGREQGFIAERYIPFKREVAVMVARSAAGQTLLLPFVETFQEDSRCLWVKGPLKPSAKLEELGKRLERFLKKTGYVGIMGVELFDTGKEYLVNELAPRVHNSGHYSLDALSDDQFSIHLKAILGCDLGNPHVRTDGFAMFNLLGRTGRAPQWRLKSDIRLHWYGKRENRPGRKMGHINALANSPDQALAIAKRRALQDFEL